MGPNSTATEISRSFPAGLKTFKIAKLKPWNS